MNRVALLLLLVAGLRASAQDLRYELGRRVISFEREWDKADSPEARKRTSALLQNAVNSFFSLRMGAAGQALDDGRYALNDKKMTPVQQWAESLSVTPENRLLDAKAKELKFTLSAYYDSKQPIAKDAKVVIHGLGAKPVKFPIKPLPMTFTVPLPARERGGDSHVWATIEAGDVKVDGLPFNVSFVVDRDARLAAQSKLIDTMKNDSVEYLTARQHADIVDDLARGKTLETDYPAARFVEEIDLALAAAKKGEVLYKADSEILRDADQFWLTVKTDQGYSPVRLFVPEEAKKNKEDKWPLVVAMHGAGGSENMFFDAYGDGCCRKECEKRGWLMVATRGGFAGGPPAPAILAELMKRYPIDPKRVYVVGHSMGSGHAFSAVQAKPELYAAVAGLGGAGVIRKQEVFAKFPVFIGVGDKDFALRGAKGLADSFKQRKAEKVTYKEYSDIEHLAIVRAAIEDVFAFFETSKRE